MKIFVCDLIEINKMIFTYYDFSRDTAGQGLFAVIILYIQLILILFILLFYCWSRAV